MAIQAESKHRSAIQHPKGFSLVEVLVAFLILMIVIVGVFQSRLNSVRRMEQSGQMNQTQDRIRQDIASIRKAALIWQCQPGTACSGRTADRDNPVRYNVSHCQEDDPLAEFPIQSKPLSSDNPNIQISRVVAINDRQLDITYIDKNRDSYALATTSIIPQAMNWCQ
tara:strand:+ start:1212 stop:1712 length:501 start_codon:yes stop_codon:yes gene_type:complete